MAYQYPPDLQEFLKKEMQRGNYDSEDAFFADLLRMLKREREEALEGIDAGLSSMRRDEGKPAERVFDELLRRHSILDDET